MLSALENIRGLAESQQNHTEVKWILMEVLAGAVGDMLEPVLIFLMAHEVNDDVDFLSCELE